MAARNVFARDRLRGRPEGPAVVQLLEDTVDLGADRERFGQALSLLVESFLECDMSHAEPWTAFCWCVPRVVAA